MTAQTSTHLIEILDRPKSIPAGLVKNLGIELLDRLKLPTSRLTLAFVSNERMRELNRQFRGKDSTTDVLSFPIGDTGLDGREYLGDIAISPDKAKEQARALGHNLLTEVLQLFAHGVLHLSGYDHEADDGEMDDMELRLRAEIVARYCR